MQIVIEIPDTYKEAYDLNRCESYFNSIASNNFGCMLLRDAFKNSVVLPNKHGRLVDVDKLPIEDLGVATGVTEGDINRAPTILEATEGEV